ncbi:MAG: hypothetical protein ACR2LN_07575 [Candidatus Levyibacteriota bacterium]
MISIAYTISPYLSRYLEKVEVLRQQIILYPLAPRREMELQFVTTVDRIKFALALIEQPIPPSSIRTILSNQIVFAMQKNPKLDSQQAAVLHYKAGLDYIKRNWTRSPGMVTGKNFEELFACLSDQPIPVTEQRMKEIVSYLQTSADNPLIQAAIAKLLFRSIIHSGTEGEAFSTLCAYLFLYKGGQDCRGLILLERAWHEDKKIFLGQYNTVIAKQNITNWVEFFVKTLSIELENIQQNLSQNPHLVDHENIGKLNERQKTIMTLLDDPKTVITNRTVQKIFHISQITASRDLAKLTNLGLLFTQGKGRSVRYTRI